MGNPQKNKRMVEAENNGKASKVRETDASQPTEGPVQIKSIEVNGQTISSSDTAGYIHEMAIELKGLAETAKLSFLAYLLDLVIEESGVQKRGRL